MFLQEHNEGPEIALFQVYRDTEFINRAVQQSNNWSLQSMGKQAQRMAHGGNCVNQEYKTQMTHTHDLYVDRM